MIALYQLGDPWDSSLNSSIVYRDTDFPQNHLLAKGMQINVDIISLVSVTGSKVLGSGLPCFNIFKSFYFHAFSIENSRINCSDL